MQDYAEGEKRDLDMSLSGSSLANCTAELQASQSLSGPLESVVSETGKGLSLAWGC